MTWHELDDGCLLTSMRQWRERVMYRLGEVARHMLRIQRHRRPLAAKRLQRAYMWNLMYLRAPFGQRARLDGLKSRARNTLFMVNWPN